MSCNSPLLAYRTENDTKLHFLNRDKWTIFAAEKAFGKENVFLLPCRKCSSCILAKRKEYAVRCAMEAKEYGDNCSFITLTYDEYHNKGYLVKRDLQYFIKKLRNKGYNFRYFGCGEYGSGGRPHYHLITFGYVPKDMKFYSESKTEFPIFLSDEVATVWNKGFITVQRFSPEVASYVAGYVNKKLGKDSGFLLMSKKPGLGYKYLVEHADKIKDYDYIIDDLGSIKKSLPPKYFDRVAKQIGLDLDFNMEKRNEVMMEAYQTEAIAFNCDRQSLLNKQKQRDDKKLNQLRRRNL